MPALYSWQFLPKIWPIALFRAHLAVGASQFIYADNSTSRTRLHFRAMKRCPHPMARTLLRGSGHQIQVALRSQSMPPFRRHESITNLLVEYSQLTCDRIQTTIGSRKPSAKFNL
jgi:hypothetical protein